MEQYIPKSALVAEIEKCYNECLKRTKITDSDYWNAKADAYRNVLAILNDTLEVIEIGVDLGDPKGDKSAKYIIDTNTLEVKEVDLEKEIQRQYNVHKNPDNSIAKDCVIMTKDGFEYFAKYFFELGMQVSNKAQKGE